jgi:hypothetical protein
MREEEPRFRDDTGAARYNEPRVLAAVQLRFAESYFHSNGRANYAAGYLTLFSKLPDALIMPVRLPLAPTYSSLLFLLLFPIVRY